MAIDPTTPLTPILPAHPAGTPPDSVAVLQAMARQALTNMSAELGQIVDRPATPQTPKGGTPVEQVGQTSTQDAGHTADAASTAKGAPQAQQQALAAKPTPETRMARAVRTAAAEAVPRQVGIAPLMANVRAVVDRPDMPPEVREAGRALLAQTPEAADLATPQGLRQAVERSGVFLEARMARAAATPPTAAGETAPALPQANDMKAALLVFRGALSAWLARAVPQSATEPPTEPAAESRSTPTEPGEPTVRATPQSAGAQPALAQTTPTQAATRPSSPALAQTTSAEVPNDAPAVTTQATSTPSPTIAQAEEAIPAPRPNMPAPQPPEDEQLAARFGSFVAPPKASPNPVATMRQALSPLIQAGLLAEETVAEEPLPLAEAKTVVARGYGAPAAEIARSKVPPPPYAGGPMAGQKPTAPALSPGQPTIDVVRGLLKGASGALARQDLMQIASLPEAQQHDPETLETRPQGARLNLDLPFVTPQGVAVAQFEISHDGGGSSGGAAGPAERTYKARFSIDIEPLGPVHAMVTLTGSRTRVSLWAERAETIARLRAGEESLGAALREAELTPEVAVHSGAPPSPGGVSPLGHFVDQAS
ncbi:flagellar hook-length control protein FliK [Caulobacter sp.]|uniref:flagellar hook-length control protein FliK n=1 Tax=Caulobacter sp. TaxID=78 RepID=UPI001B0933F9|nr:flagellar hook-length control protein FliK [Caulobacter sp.]MBO9546797.1 flagellar hook-length control protein FliK [Caulobacter sp.]